MADGFTLDIDAELAEQLSSAAAAAGVSREAYALAVLEQDSKGGPRFTIARARAYDVDRGGEVMSMEEAFEFLDAALVRPGTRPA
ncbi:hypothetical protein G5B46_12620 [Caulobacter sp. 602-2]|uniref:Uncharacterized protein n=1 Tax=Caulobacter sp. 602-2 TaxID=2710887 RepID=A0A6G4QYY8_9CAUL|nr:hypothetical protein [Caulobacter sp. 602-2]NGM50455.1 hypothetical protein [Caulobacter sp. 602-2]